MDSASLDVKRILDDLHTVPLRLHLQLKIDVKVMCSACHLGVRLDLRSRKRMHKQYISMYQFVQKTYSNISDNSDKIVMLGAIYIYYIKIYLSHFI